MTPQPGSTITYRPALGKVKQMRVDLVHEVGVERWLFSGVDALGNWAAVNGRHILGVK
jgi:hypothetical protein